MAAERESPLHAAAFLKKTRQFGQRWFVLVRRGCSEGRGAAGGKGRVESLGWGGGDEGATQRAEEWVPAGRGLTFPKITTLFHISWSLVSFKASWMLLFFTA